MIDPAIASVVNSPVDDSAAFDLGSHRLRFLVTPYVHQWDSMLAYDEASNTRYGPAAAYATILFLYVAVVAYVFVKLLGADIIGMVQELWQSSSP